MTDSLNASLSALDAFKTKYEDVFGDNITKIADKSFSSLTRSLNKALKTGELSFSNFGDVVKQSLTGILEQSGSRIINDVALAPLQSGISSAIGSLFGGARAHGGSVQPGRAFLVGEQGPELFVPSTPGQIKSNGASGGGAPNINVTIQTQDANSFIASRGQVSSALASAVRSSGRYV